MQNPYLNTYEISIDYLNLQIEKLEKEIEKLQKLKK